MGLGVVVAVTAVTTTAVSSLLSLMSRCTLVFKIILSTCSFFREISTASSGRAEVEDEECMSINKHFAASSSSSAALCLFFREISTSILEISSSVMMDSTVMFSTSTVVVLSSMSVLIKSVFLSTAAVKKCVISK